MPAFAFRGAVNVAADQIPGLPATERADVSDGQSRTLAIEHPSVRTTIIAEMANDGLHASVAILQTAWKLMAVDVFA